MLHIQMQRDGSSLEMHPSANATVPGSKTASSLTEEEKSTDDRQDSLCNTAKMTRQAEVSKTCSKKYIALVYMNQAYTVG